MAAEHLQASLATGVGHVRPSVVVGMEADLGGPRRLCLEQVVQQVAEGEVELCPGFGAGVFGERDELYGSRVGQGSVLLSLGLSGWARPS
jgi:hypothetical protein